MLQKGQKLTLCSACVQLYPGSANPLPILSITMGMGMSRASSRGWHMSPKQHCAWQHLSIWPGQVAQQPLALPQPEGEGVAVPAGSGVQDMATAPLVHSSLPSLAPWG